MVRYSRINQLIQADKVNTMMRTLQTCSHYNIPLPSQQKDHIFRIKKALKKYFLVFLMSNEDFLLLGKAIPQKEFSKGSISNRIKIRINFALPLDPGAKAALLMA